MGIKAKNKLLTNKIIKLDSLLEIDEKIGK